MCLYNDPICHKKRIAITTSRRSCKETPVSGGCRVSPLLSSSFSVVIVALACLLCGENDRLNPFPYHAQARSSMGRYNLTSPLQSTGGIFRVRREHAHSPETRQLLLSSDQLDSYAKDGFVVISGLLDHGELDRLVGATDNLISNHIGTLGDKPLSSGHFQVHDFGLIFDDKNSSLTEGENYFRDVALHSKVPLAAAELMQLDDTTQNLRILRDVFLAKGHQSTTSCGWHVDDQLFWPTAYQLPPSSQIDQSGINAWIALDDMPSDYGGSMSVSPGSHQGDFPWVQKAYTALGFENSIGNGISKDDLFEIIKSGQVDTCGLEKIAPHLHEEIEKSKQEFNFKRGDVIFMNRWLFHKSNQLTEKGKQALQAIKGSSNSDPRGSFLKRYSVRYVTGNTSLPNGFVTEMSVLASDGSNLGRVLDNIDGEWYPKCWPEVVSHVDAKMEYLVKNELPIAQEKLASIMSEIMSLFQSR